MWWPPPREVQVWFARLDVPAEPALRFCATLSGDERARSAGFRSPRDRQRFIVAHGVLRALLGRYLQRPPQRIGYVHNAFGKPALRCARGRRLSFNLSHSAGLVLVAIARARDVRLGVDVEHLRAPTDHADIAQGFFSPREIRQLSALARPLDAEAFLGCWTQKEAYLKARGEGLTVPLDGFSVPVRPHPAARSAGRVVTADPATGQPWTFCRFHPARGYIGALAVEGSGWRVSFRSLDYAGGPRGRVA